MAINPATQYPGQVATPDAAYPYGGAQNITTPGDGQGTPWEAALVNDIFGFQQALLSFAGVTPSGAPDQVGAAQYLQALARVGLFRWKDEVTYPAGARVFGPTDGRVYLALLSQSGNDPEADDGTNWEPQPTVLEHEAAGNPHPQYLLAGGVLDDRQAAVGLYVGFVDRNGATAVERLPGGWSSSRTGVGVYVVTHGLGMAIADDLLVDLYFAAGDFSVTARTGNSFTVTNAGAFDEPFRFKAVQIL